MSRTSRVYAGLFLIALAGCSNSTQPVDPAPDNIITVDVTTAVQAAPSIAASGSMVDLTLSVTNNGSSAVRLEFYDTCQLVYGVYDQDGRRVSGDFACGEFPTSLTLEPGETQHKSYEWETVGHGPSGPYPLPPGDYRIQASLMRHGFPSQWVTVRVQ